MSPMTLVRLARIQLFVRLCCKAPTELYNVVMHACKDSRSWAQTLLRDLRWLTQDPYFSDCVGYSIHQWRSFVESNPKRFKQRTNKFSRFRIANMVIDRPSSPVRESEQFHTCCICHSPFPTFQCMCLHLFNCHGIKKCLETLCR